jgi:hypothetical protein
MPKSKTLDYEQFMGRFGWKAYDEDTRVMEPPLRVSSVPELRVLVQAARHNCPSAFSAFLQQWLLRLGIDAPEGVFRPIHRRRGRPKDPEAGSIHLLWIAIGSPSLASTKLAKAYDGDAYHAADAATRKEMVDRLRQAVERFEQRTTAQREWTSPKAFTPPD